MVACGLDQSAGPQCLVFLENLHTDYIALRQTQGGQFDTGLVDLVCRYRYRSGAGVHAVGNPRIIQCLEYLPLICVGHAGVKQAVVGFL